MGEARKYANSDKESVNLQDGIQDSVSVSPSPSSPSDQEILRTLKRSMEQQALEQMCKGFGTDLGPLPSSSSEPASPTTEEDREEQAAIQIPQHLDQQASHMLKATISHPELALVENQPNKPPAPRVPRIISRAQVQQQQSQSVSQTTWTISSTPPKCPPPPPCPSSPVSSSSAKKRRMEEPAMKSSFMQQDTNTNDEDDWGAWKRITRPTGLSHEPTPSIHPVHSSPTEDRATAKAKPLKPDLSPTVTLWESIKAMKKARALPRIPSPIKRRLYLSHGRALPAPQDLDNLVSGFIGDYQGPGIWPTRHLEGSRAYSTSDEWHAFY